MVMDMYRKMFLSLMPKNLKAQLAKDKGTVGDGVKYLLLASILATVFGIIGTVLQMLLQVSGGGSAVMFGAEFLVGVAMLLVLTPTTIIIWSFIATGAMYLLARTLGGAGTFESQYYHFAIAWGGLLMVLNIVSIVPCLGQIVVFLLAIFWLYLCYLVYMSVHKLSSGKAIVLVVLPIVVLLVLMAIAFALFAAMLTTMASQITTAGAY